MGFTELVERPEAVIEEEAWNVLRSEEMCEWTLSEIQETMRPIYEYEDSIDSIPTLIAIPRVPEGLPCFSYNSSRCGSSMTGTCCWCPRLQRSGWPAGPRPVASFVRHASEAPATITHPDVDDVALGAAEIFEAPEFVPALRWLIDQTPIEQSLLSDIKNCVTAQLAIMVNGPS